MNAPTLPSDDVDPEARRRQIAEREAAWPVTYDRFAGVAMATGVPKPDLPDVVWFATVAEILAKIAVNAEEVAQRMSALHPSHPEHEAAMALIRDAERGGIHVAFDHLQALTQGDDEEVRPTSIAEYDGLFRSIPLPPSAADLDQDTAFARMRLAGPNPMTLARIERVPDGVSLTEADVARAASALAAAGHDIAGCELGAALHDGRAFAADYRALHGVAGGRWGRWDKHLYGPVALFFTVGRARTLLPVAIQPAPGAPLVTPADGEAWRVAKTMATVADGNVHQAVSHLAHTHLVLEAVTLAVRRGLAEQHPVARLLEPHFQGTLYINDAADTKLAAPGGGVDAVMGGPIAFSRSAAAQGVADWSFRGTMLENDLRARGLDDRAALPEHPYRDDALLVNGAIRRWVEGYLRTWYRTDAALAADDELQAMFRWLGAPEGGRLRDVPLPATVADLVDAVTHVIFTASAQHAAVNFPQLPIMAYAPAFPLAGYDPAADPATTSLFDLLPPIGQAHYQATLGTLLGSVHHTVLGEYPRHLLHNFAGDPRIDAHLTAFQADLREVERLIGQRNAARPPYPFLLPSRIPQSINI
ncbi:MAG: lipoxygenase family protein [Myxococcota bacterium]